MPFAQKTPSAETRKADPNDLIFFQLAADRRVEFNGYLARCYDTFEHETTVSIAAEINASE